MEDINDITQEAGRQQLVLLPGKKAQFCPNVFLIVRLEAKPAEEVELKKTLSVVKIQTFKESMSSL